MMHFVSRSCDGESCTFRVKNDICGEPATHKVGEEIQNDEPMPYAARHNLTAYVCCKHFLMVVGPAASCILGERKTEAGNIVVFADITPKQHEALREEVFKTRSTIGKVVRQALDFWLKSRKPS